MLHSDVIDSRHGMGFQPSFDGVRAGFTGILDRDHLTAIRRAVEARLEAWMKVLAGQQNTIGAVRDMVRTLADEIVENPLEEVIDSDESRVNQLHDFEGKTKKLWEAWREVREESVGLPELKDNLEQSLLVELDKTITLCEQLHDALVELRWAILEHDADLSEVEEGEFTDASGLMATIRGG